MKFTDPSRRFDLNWLLSLNEEDEFEEVDALIETFRTAEPEAAESESLDEAIEHLYTQGGIFCPLCGAVFDPEGSAAR
jgi:hypothetical protein